MKRYFATNMIHGGFATVGVVALAISLMGCGGGSGGGSGMPEPPTDGRNTTSQPTPISTPAPVATPAPTPVKVVSSPEEQTLEQAAIARINQIRQENGVAPLAVDATLTQLAEQYSQKMKADNFFAHEDNQGKRIWDRAASVGYTYIKIGENLAKVDGNKDIVEYAVQGWLNSPTHRANLLDPEFTETGIGVAKTGDIIYFTHIFGEPQ